MSSNDLTRRLADELHGIPLIDPHSHINPHAAASTTLADLLGYHYYTELAHSAGLPKSLIEEPSLDPKEKVHRLVGKIGDLENTIQYSWLIEMCQVFFGFQEDRLTLANWEHLYDTAAKKMAEPDWEDQVLTTSRLEQVFLTNDFDDPLTGFDTHRYIPCLRTDDLVFHLAKPDTQQRLAKATGITVTNSQTLVDALGKLFQHFTAHGCRACAISLPPSFEPAPVSANDVEAPLRAALTGKPLSNSEATTLSNFVFWNLAQYCVEFKLPFDLMIGVNRRVYADGVYQGMDLFDQRCSLIQYQKLLNAFPQVTFPISVLANSSNHELVSYAWIFPNVVTNGHWWYSNIPAYIENDCRSRLQAVPQTKQIGYYSDMYKLEFGLPKFTMYRRVLAKVLADDFVIARGWSEERALELGRLTLRGNVERIFGM
ncbi:MAG: uxaC [Planctomycetaceae bacterium]|nr:uxaC [Planctomycetaceae bacterium]